MAQNVSSKTHPELATRTGALSLSQAACLLFGLMVTTLLGCWYAGYRLGVDRHPVTNFYWLMFIVAYGVALTLPWLDLKGQEGLDRSQPDHPGHKSGEHHDLQDVQPHLPSRVRVCGSVPDATWPAG